MYDSANFDKQNQNDLGKNTGNVLLLGVVLEFVGAFKFIEEFAGAGITIPITGFGSTIVKGAREGAKNRFV